MKNHGLFDERTNPANGGPDQHPDTVAVAIIDSGISSFTEIVGAGPSHAHAASTSLRSTAEMDISGAFHLPLTRPAALHEGWEDDAVLLALDTSAGIAVSVVELGDDGLGATLAHLRSSDPRHHADLSADI